MNEFEVNTSEDMHPLDFLYTHGLRTLRHLFETVPCDPSETCSNCNRAADSWVEPCQIVYASSSYGGTESRCPACQSLFVGDLDVTGTERLTSSGTPVPLKMGMMRGGGMLVTEGQAILEISRDIPGKKI